MNDAPNAVAADISESKPKPKDPVATAPTRFASVDAYRGLVMFLMMAEVLRLGRVSHALPDSKFWAFLANHQSHSERISTKFVYYVDWANNVTLALAHFLSMSIIHKAMQVN